MEGGEQTARRPLARAMTEKGGPPFAAPRWDDLGSAKANAKPIQATSDIAARASRSLSSAAAIRSF